MRMEAVQLHKELDWMEVRHKEEGVEVEVGVKVEPQGIVVQSKILVVLEGVVVLAEGEEEVEPFEVMRVQGLLVVLR